MVLGAVERGGDIITKVVPNVKRSTIMPHINEVVLPGTTIHTDGLPTYRAIGKNGYTHEAVNHHKGQYVTPTGCHTQTIEGFWAQLKRGINGTHIHVSGKHLPKYLGEFEFRWNMRHTPHLMLDRLLYSFAR